MSCFLGLESSMEKGSLALSNSKVLKKTSWTHCLRPQTKSHSHKMILEIEKLLKKTNTKLSDLDFLSLGVGPGRWTGLRTTINTAKALAFSLKIPLYPVGSLRVCAEPFLATHQIVLVAFNAFKNQVYFSQFNSLKDLEVPCKILNFKQALKKIYEIKKNSVKKKLICLSDLEDFYPLPSYLKQSVMFKKHYPLAEDLAKIIHRQKDKRELKTWNQIKAFYLRSI